MDRSRTTSAGTLTLSASGDALEVEVGKDTYSFLDAGSLIFTPITASSAVIAPGQTYGASYVGCATSTITSGALTLDGDHLVVSLVGEGCGDATSTKMSCTVPKQATGTLKQPRLRGDSGPSGFPVGNYLKCNDDLVVAGQMALTRSRGVLTAAIDAQTNVGLDVGPANGNLEFIANTSRTATVVSGQTWLVSLPVPVGGTVPDTMYTTSGSLVVDGVTLFVFVGGAVADDPDEPFDETFHCTMSK